MESESHIVPIGRFHPERCIICGYLNGDFLDSSSAAVRCRARGVRTSCCRGQRLGSVRTGTPAASSCEVTRVLGSHSAVSGLLVLCSHRAGETDAVCAFLSSELSFNSHATLFWSLLFFFFAPCGSCAAGISLSLCVPSTTRFLSKNIQKYFGDAEYIPTHEL